jgi:hypothetical protein
MVIIDRITDMDKSNFSFKIVVNRLDMSSKEFYLPFSAHDTIWADAMGRLVLDTQLNPVSLSSTISVPMGLSNDDVQVPINDTRTPYI